MSQLIIGTEIEMDPAWIVYGNYPSYTYTIDPRIVSALAGQRDTKSKTLVKYIKECGGLDLSMSDPITIAYFPKDYTPASDTLALHHYGYCPEVGEDRWMALLDGDHRRHLHIIFGIYDIPCAYVAVESKKKYSEAYVKRNSRLRKKQSQEEIFVMECNAADPTALSTVQDLITCRLHVDGGSGPGCLKGDVGGPSVKIMAFRRGIAKLNKRNFGIKYLKLASEMIQQVYPNDTTIHADLLLGLSIFLSEYDNLPNGKTAWTSPMQKDFSVWLKNRSMKSQKQLAASLSDVAGAVVNFVPECIALGMVMEYRRENTGEIALSTKKNKMKESVIESLIKRR